MITSNHKDLEKIFRKTARVIENQFFQKGGIKRTEIQAISKLFALSFKNKELLEKFAYYLFTYVNESMTAKLESYLRSLYLSKNYEYFRKMKPADAVRHMRFYLGKRGKALPIFLAPFLLKKARDIKESIRKTMRYLQKNDLLLTDELAFEMVKEKYKNKKLTY